MKWLAIVLLFLGLAAGNYLWQWQFADVADYIVAFERTYFQGFVFIMLAVTGHLNHA